MNECVIDEIKMSIDANIAAVKSDLNKVSAITWERL
jgi:hypothetical protein